VTRIVCLGRRGGGDDAVGLAVGDVLRETGVAVEEARDGADLVDALATGERVVIVDAAVGSRPAGSVLHLRPELVADAEGLVTSHALSIAQAIGVARALHGEGVGRDVHVVAIVIAPRPAAARGLGVEVVAAVAQAAWLARQLAGS
jgi:hydrogenase maturation protease